jgi:hypothetical protein
MKNSKKCNYCKVEKSVSEYSKQARSKRGLQGECRSCNKLRRDARTEERKAYQEIYYVNNKQSLLDSQKRRDSFRKEEISKNKKEHYKKNKDLLANYKREYRRLNPGRINAWVAKRDAAKLQRTPKWLTETHLAQIELFYDSAAKLSKELSISIHVDHILPLQGKPVSGLHVPWNLQLLPAKENISKGNRL